MALGVYDVLLAGLERIESDRFHTHIARLPCLWFLLGAHGTGLGRRKDCCAEYTVVVLIRDRLDDWKAP